MRFVNQTSELYVPAPDGAVDAGFAEALRENFRREYVRAFGADAFWSNAELEVVNLRVTAVGPSSVDLARRRSRSGAARPSSRRRVFWPFDMAFAEWAVHDRAGLSAGAQVPGPAIVESADTTIVIPPGCTARVDAGASLIIQVSE
jgi:N-methylhydantoinase A